MRFSIDRKEYEERREVIREEMGKRGLDLLILQDANRIFYTTGYFFLPCGRPFFLLISKNGDLTLILPKNEVTHAEKRVPWINDVVVYWEYPPVHYPIDALTTTIKKRGYDNKKIGIDNMGLPSIVGLPDISLKEELKCVEFIPAKNIVDKMRQIKSDAELELIREAAKWGNLAHTLLQEYTEPGISEIEVTSKATHYASTMMLKALGPDYETLGLDPFCAYGRYKAGHRTSYAHGLLVNRKLREGDVIETTAYSRVGGYENHLERTMILGKPTKRQKEYFELMIKAQDAAINACKPGVKCCDVHMAAREAIKKAGYDPDDLMDHRTGRGIGLTGFELPFPVDGDETIIEPNMVFCIEPGIYLPGEACFRHCDTIIVTEDGCEDADFYPRDIESLTIVRG